MGVRLVLTTHGVHTSCNALKLIAVVNECQNTFFRAFCLNMRLPGTVAIVTSDGRMIVGTLKGFDQTINLILDESHERVFSSTQGVEQVVLGLYIVRGDNVAVIGEIDDETDSALDLGNIRAEPLNSVVH
uniref:U6 snRNA-associated Sm-like protein LSm8 n=1 Tax=Scleropages formosus TaxID=113540 RepID=A0A8C9WIS5_SCLFO